MIRFFKFRINLEFSLALRALDLLIKHLNAKVSTEYVLFMCYIACFSMYSLIIYYIAISLPVSFVLSFYIAVVLIICLFFSCCFSLTVLLLRSAV